MTKSAPIKTLSSNSTLSLISKEGSGSLSIQNSILKRSISISGGYSGSKNSITVTNSYVDVNGDGLPDRVYFDRNNVKVCLNLGYSFSEPTDWGVKDVSCISSNLSFSDAFSAGASAGSNNGVLEIFKKLVAGSSSKEKTKIVNKISKGIGISFGFNNANSSSYTLFALRDINLDGLIDKVYRNNEKKFAFSLNKGDEFADIVSLDSITDLFRSDSKSYSANLNINLRINLFWFVYLTVGGGGNYTWGSD